MLLGGFWFLLNDSWKSSLSFDASIKRFGKTAKFRFEDLSDFGLFDEVFLSETYPYKDDSEVYVIFDVGANIGVTAAYFRMRYPQAAIYSFEPDPANIKRLQFHAERLGGVKVFPYALWDEKIKLSFYTDPHRGSSSSAYKIRDRQSEILVQAVSMEDIISETKVSRIDILKFDIEGAEEKALSEFDGFNHIKMILGEIHSDLCDGQRVINHINKYYNSVSLQPFNNGRRFYLVAR